MKRSTSSSIIISVLVWLALGFVHAAASALEPGLQLLGSDLVPPTNLSIVIPQLRPCTDSRDTSLHLNFGQPVYVLVHGCFGSTGQFHGLARVLAFHGQQTVCFTYNDRDRLTQGALQLRHALNQLASQSQSRQITVIGHSQGALIAHKSLTHLFDEPIARGIDFRLVTISGPFNGIAAAQTCGRHWLYPLSLGLLPLSCYAVTGAKWQDITNSSPFIRDPGDLIPQVSEFLKIDTDERDSCRREEGRRCVKKDAVFSIAEQRSGIIEADQRAKRVEVRSGHVEIVGDERVSPLKLIAILQEQGVIPPTTPERVAAFQKLLGRIYSNK